LASLFPTSHSKAAIPQDCYPCCRGSTTSNGSCISAEHPREAIPHHLCLPKAHLGHWWSSFFFRKSTLPSTLSPSRESPQASSDRITCDLTLEAMMKQPGSQSGKANSRL
uniref:Pancreatic progenitor cell differentiation and proliferation factor n=1 Tax=Canis lupus familiaris TaxID=9615 RepID=A0A8P0TUS1_CANLF